MDNKVIWLIMVAVVFLLLFGFFYLGVLSPSVPSRPAGEGGEMAGVGTTAYGLTGRYHIYNPLAKGGFMVAFLLGAMIFFWSLVDLRERIRANIPTILALAGVLFLFMSAYSFVAGLHDLLTFTAYETTTKPTFGQQYGWFIQAVVYGIIGIAFVYLAELKRKEAGETRSVIPSVSTPIGAFMLLSTFLLFTTGFHAFMHLKDYGDYRQSLAWVIETFIFGIIAYYLLKTSEKVRREEGVTKSIFSFPSLSLGILFTLITLAVYIFSSFDYIYRTYGAKDLNWFVESVIFGALAVCFSILGDSIAKKEGEEPSGFPTSMYIAGVFLLILATLQFFIGFNEFLYSNNPELKWLWEFLLLGIPGAIAVLAAEYARKKSIPLEKQPEKAKRRMK